MSVPGLPRVGPEAFEGRRLRSRGTVAVAFLADWCPFCRDFEPGFAALAPTPGLGLEVADLTSLESPLWERFEVDIVPTVVVFADGEAVFRADGVAGEGLGPEALEGVRQAARRTAGRSASASRRSPGP